MHLLSAFDGKNNAMNGFEVRCSGCGAIPKLMNSSRSFMLPDNAPFLVLLVIYVHRHDGRNLLIGKMT